MLVEDKGKRVNSRITSFANELCAKGEIRHLSVSRLPHLLVGRCCLEGVVLCTKLPNIPHIPVGAWKY